MGAFSYVAAQSANDSLWIQLRDKKILDQQEKENIQRIELNGYFVTALISASDTLILAEIDNVNISSPRYFESNEDYIKYLKYKRYAASVYPFAKEAIRIFREAEYVTKNMSKRKKKKYLKKLSDDLEREFKTPLKQLSKTQGKILIEMIERELNTSILDLIKMTEGPLRVFYWNQSSKLYGYRLKKVYTAGENPILDVVLQDFDISYQIIE